MSKSQAGKSQSGYAKPSSRSSDHAPFPTRAMARAPVAIGSGNSQPTFAAACPEALWPVSDDGHDDKVPRQNSGADRTTEAEHGEQPTAGFGKRRDVCPEESGPETHRVEPTGDGGDRPALADQAELEKSMRNHHTADHHSE
jgi:hypothetical protein